MTIPLAAVLPSPDLQRTPHLAALRQLAELPELLLLAPVVGGRHEGHDRHSGQDGRALDPAVLLRMEGLVQADGEQPRCEQHLDGEVVKGTPQQLQEGHLRQAWRVCHLVARAGAAAGS